MSLIIDQTAQHAQNSHERKILLITLYSDFNYGNVLQRYALTKTLEKQGFNVEHLCASLNGNHFIIRKFRQAVKLILALIGIKEYRKQFQAWKQEQSPQGRARKQIFRTFQDRFTTTKIFMTYQETINAPKSRWDDYDFAVTGSDQVWHNWTHTREELEYYYLSFMPREKRVNYAPSFGYILGHENSKFLEQDIELHKKGLLGFERLSCREQKGVDFIHQLTGLNAQLVLDPTLLLNSAEWQEIEAKPQYELPERFVLYYFLGGVPQEFSEALNEAAGDLPVINIFAVDDSMHFMTGPAEFLYLLKRAEKVCTNSFHGTAFSVNFGKNFISFINDKEGSGRIESLLSALGLTERIYNGKICKSEINYDEVYKKLNTMRESSMKYLRECLKMSN